MLTLFLHTHSLVGQVFLHRGVVGIAPPFAPTPRSPSDKKVDDVRLKKPFYTLKAAVCQWLLVFVYTCSDIGHADDATSHSPSHRTVLHLQPETLLSDNKDPQVSKYNYIYIIICIIKSKTHCKSGHICAAESTHGHWSAEIRPHHIQDFHWHSMTLSGLSRYTEEGDSSVCSRWRMMWSKNTVCVGWLMKSRQVE